MDKISRIYAAAQKCGFEVKHRVSAETGKILIALKAQDIDLDLYFWVCVDDHANELQFVGNVAHEVFLFSENMDTHTETRKYLDKIGGTLQQYTEVYSQMTALAWQIRKFWLSL